VRYVCMRRVGPAGRGRVGRGRVACWASVATVALCRHDPYSIYLMFAIVALSPDALECPGKYVYHVFGQITQCVRDSLCAVSAQWRQSSGPVRMQSAHFTRIELPRPRSGLRSTAARRGSPYPRSASASTGSSLTNLGMADVPCSAAAPCHCTSIALLLSCSLT